MTKALVGVSPWICCEYFIVTSSGAVQAAMRLFLRLEILVLYIHRALPIFWGDDQTCQESDIPQF
jgi:hypothetical protein